MRIHKKLFTNTLFVSLIQVVLFIVIHLIQKYGLNNGFWYGLEIFDGISLSKSFDTLRTLYGLDISNYSDYSLWGLYYFYYLFDKIFWLPNLVLIFMSIYLINKIYYIAFKNYNIAVGLIVILNPYNILAIGYINKEIILQFLVLLFIYLIINNSNKFFIYLTVAVTFLFRDAYGLIFTSFLIFLILFKERINRGLITSFIVLSILSMVILLFQDIYFIKRSIDMTVNSFNNGEMLVSNSGLFNYYYRIIGNILFLAKDPNFLTTNHGIYTLGLAYFSLGIVLLYIFIINVYGYLIFKNSDLPREQRIIFSFMILGILLISMSFFIMPRYLFPFLPIYFIFTIFIIKNHPYKKYNILIFISPSLFICWSMYLIIINKFSGISI